jgi:hypothetical protein
MEIIKIKNKIEKIIKKEKKKDGCGYRGCG